MISGLSSLSRDLRYSVRSLLKTPAFTTISVLTLAMGIGANSAIFSVVKSVLLAPLPYDDPEELVVVGGGLPGLGTQDLTASAPEFRDYVEQSSSLEELAAAWTIDINITGIDRPVRGRDALVTWNFHSMLGARPILGRGFRPEEAGGDIGHVTLISYDAWQRLYGGDPDVIGRTMLIDDDPHEIIGVMSRDFVHPGAAPESPIDTWGAVDLGQESRFGQGRNARRYTLIGRLKPGLDSREAQAEFLVIADNLRGEYPASYPEEAGWTISVVPLMERVVGDVRTSLFVILGSVSFVLLIACTNVANLMLARGSARGRETAIRSAVGGGRSAIGRQFLLDSIVLGAAGGALGLLVAYGGTALIRDSASAYLPRITGASVDGGVLIFTMVVSLGTSVLFGLIPAVRLSRTNLQQLLRETSVGISSGNDRLRNALVVAEVAISLTLLVGSGLMLKSYQKLMAVELGFDAESVMTMRTFLPWTIQPEDGRYFDPAVRIRFYDEGLRLLGELQDVESAALVTRLPLRRLNGTSFAIEGASVTVANLAMNAEFRQVSPNYFDAMGVPLVQGRRFAPSDAAGTPLVVVVNEVWAERYSSDESPIGRRVRIGGNPNSPFREIVGVVGNVRHRGLDVRPRETIYMSYRQGIFIDATWVIRTHGTPEEITQSAIAAIHSLDATLPVFSPISMEQVVAGTVAERRLVMLLLSLFATQAIVLAAIGIYGVMAQAVTQRTREIGIRMAMGAERRNILALVLRDGLGLGAAGVVVGAVLSAVGSGLLTTLLYSVDQLDPGVFLSMALMALLVVAAATVVPAARATRVDPLLTMKAD